MCERDLGADATPCPAAPEGFAWAAIWCWTRCPSCRAEVPVDCFDERGVSCPACGKSHGIAAPGEALEHAHAVADLASPSGTAVEGDNPFAAIGVTEVWSEALRDAVETVGSQRRATLNLRAAPGHPLCDVCRRPLSVASDAPGVLSVRCESCRSGYVSRIEARALSGLGALRGIIAAPHRSDRPTAVVEVGDDGAPSGLLCPDCTAPLPRGGGRERRCQECRVFSLVPAGLWRLPPSAKPPRFRSWALFEGPSAVRGALTEVARLRASGAAHAVRRERARDDEATAVRAMASASQRSIAVDLTQQGEASKNARRLQKRRVLIALVVLVGLLAFAFHQKIVEIFDPPVPDENLPE